MKKFISRVQNLSQKAAEFKAAMQQVPPKVAEIREAVAMTTGQLRQLRSDVESTVSDLKADNEQTLIESLQEINASSELFRQAGYELGGVDMELSPVQRLIVHLNRVKDVPLSIIRSLRTANEDRRITHALLNSLIQAEQLADQIDLAGLVYYKLVAHVGPIPSVRLCWCVESEEVVETPTPSTRAPAATQPAPASSFASYGKSSFFERAAPTVAEAVSVATPVPVSQPVAAETSDETDATTQHAAPEAPPVEPKPATPSGARDWGRESLERFKKMPNVSKYRR